MDYIIRFYSRDFDVSQEDPNPFNPIAGQSLLQWLQTKLVGQFQLDEPGTEDWGWYTHIDFKGRKYMLGSSACSSADEEDNELEWVLRIDKQRGLKEILLGRAKMTEKDECLAFFKDLIEKNPLFYNVEIE